MCCYHCCYFEIARFCKNHVHGLFLLRTPPIVQLYFLKSNSPSKWIVRIPVHQVLRQSFSLVWSSLSVTCLSLAQNSVRNASPGNVIKGSWCERTGWLKVAQTENYAWRNTFTPLKGTSAFFRCWSFGLYTTKKSNSTLCPFMTDWFWHI